jgi:hypothetical protein
MDLGANKGEPTIKLIKLLLAATAFALVAMISMPARATCGTAKAFTTSTAVFGNTYTDVVLTIPAGQPGAGGNMPVSTYWCAVAGW